MDDRPDEDGVGDGPYPDAAAEQPAGDQHGELDAGAHQSHRMLVGRDIGHQLVARTWP